MNYWTYTPDNVDAFNEKLRIKIAEFPKGHQSQKQASSHYDGYNHHKSHVINWPEFENNRGYASHEDPDAKTGYVYYPTIGIDKDPHQQYKTIFWAEGIVSILHEFARDVAVRPESGLNYEINVPIMWFHQMYKGDYDNWHNHIGCQYVGVYFIDLPEGEQTELMDFEGNVMQPEVKEGQLLIFPSGYLHRSPPRVKEGEKTIISFNFNIASRYTKEILAKVKKTHPQNYFDEEDFVTVPPYKETNS